MSVESTNSPYIYVTSRSRIETGDECPRKRWLGHEYLGRGLEGTRVNIPMSIGVWVHKGVEILMAYFGVLKLERDAEIEVRLESTQEGMQGEKVVGGGVEDCAVEVALWGYEEQVRERNFAPEDLGDSEGEEATRFVYEEARALIEALVRVFSRIGLERVLEKYEVVEVEEDRTVHLGQLVEHAWDSGECVLCGVTADTQTKYCPGVGFRSITDARLRERGTGDLHVFSLKTGKEWGPSNEEAAKYDQQGRSEMWAIREHLKLAGSEEADRVMGVQMLHLLKGRQVKVKENGPAPMGVKFHDSSLLHPYRLEEVVSDDDKFCDSLFYQCAEPHTVVNYQNRKGKQVRVEKECEGGANHKRTGAWSKCNVWELEGGVKAWIGRLEHVTTDLGLFEDLEHVLELAMVMPEVYFRGDESIRDWHEQTVASEVEMAQRAIRANEVLVEKGPKSEELRHELNRGFKQDVQRCVWGFSGIKCQFIAVCHEGVIDPLGSGLYRLRKGREELT